MGPGELYEYLGNGKLMEMSKHCKESPCKCLNKVEMRIKDGEVLTSVSFFEATPPASAVSESYSGLVMMSG